MRHERLRVTRDNNTVHSLTVAPWEFPVLELLFGEGNVVSTDEFVNVDREYPDPKMEFTRLQKAYGADVKTDVPHAVTVFGNSRDGVRALAKAIDSAKADEEAAKPKRRQRGRFAMDPLLA